jgi:hypothetical protein
LESREKFENLKSPKIEFCYKNIIPIPSFLIEAIIELPSFDPYSVAKAFFDEMEEFANFCQAPLVDSPKIPIFQRIITTKKILLISRIRMIIKMDSTLDLLKWLQTTET